MGRQLGQVSIHARGLVIAGQNWGNLLKPANGGPGELPGRVKAINDAKKRSELRRKIKTAKKKK